MKKTHPLYQTWRNMLSRCDKPYATHYHAYGGRGITVCDRWRDFWAFVADVGQKPGAGYTLDRKDNNGNYEPSNFRWASKADQMRNTRAARWVEINGVKMLAMDVAATVGIGTASLVNRVKSGLPPEKILGPRSTGNHNPKEAIKASVAARLARTHCKNGHEFNSENSYTGTRGERTCRVCASARSRANKAKRKSMIKGFDHSTSRPESP